MRDAGISEIAVAGEPTGAGPDVVLRAAGAASKRGTNAVESPEAVTTADIIEEEPADDAIVPWLEASPAIWAASSIASTALTIDEKDRFMIEARGTLQDRLCLNTMSQHLSRAAKDQRCCKAPLEA